jgi:hypothetical protein
VVAVTFRVGWHGYVIPEFSREVKIVDVFPEDGFVLVDGTNVYEYHGCGGSDQYTYVLKVVGQAGETVELPKPKLYLDNTEIPLVGTRPTIQILQ